VAYTPIDITKPTTAQTRQAGIDAIRSNTAGLLDLLVIAGEVPGYDESYSGGTAAQPAVYYWKNGSTWLRVDTTWGTTGGAANKPTKEAYYISIDAGANWDPLTSIDGKYVATTTYDTLGFWLNTTWGSTP
jgi:hypothetical protein